MWKYHPNDEKDKSLYEGMVKLLWNSEPEEQHRKCEWMDVPPDTGVYLETVETAKNQETEAGRGVDSHYAVTIAYDRKGGWFNAGNKAVN